MTTHNIIDAVKKLLPHAEAEQENLYCMAKKQPDEYQAGYEDCRHAVSYAYEAMAKPEAEKKLISAALSELIDAAQSVIDNWAEGDLAGAVRGLDVSINEARAALADEAIA